MTDKNDCPLCGREMKSAKIPEIGSPEVGVCPVHGMTSQAWVPD